jgi:Rps23 Pro-64 3,4-dihydroxylase Tpa1-like proline 4-hydroxylase
MENMKNKINVIDNFLSEEQYNIVQQYCETCSYVYGECDNRGLPPTGMTHEIKVGTDMYTLFESKTRNLNSNSNLNLNRMYINCFAPSEKPYFHIDGNYEDITFLYYPTSFWTPDSGGETQFLVNNEIYGVIPIPNRVIYFDANILHCATPFRDRHRFTVAIKYNS